MRVITTQSILYITVNNIYYSETTVMNAPYFLLLYLAVSYLTYTYVSLFRAASLHNILIQEEFAKLKKDRQWERVVAGDTVEVHR